MENKRGLIKMVLVIIVALIVLGYFGYSLRDIVNKPIVKDNLAYVWNLMVYVWNNFLAGPAGFIWDKVIINLIWHPLSSVLKI